MKFLNLFVVAVTASVSTGCANEPPSPPPPPAGLSAPNETQKAMFAKVIRRALKDPDSAKFGDMVVVDNGYGACVEVNSKNAYGGYTGFQQAVLFNSKDFGWNVVEVKDVSAAVCIKVLHTRFLVVNNK